VPPTPGPGRVRRRWPARLLRLAGWASAGMALVLVVVLGATWLWWRPAPPATERSRGVNALWLGHRWVGQPHSAAEYAALAGTLRRAGISDALFHAGPLNGDGTVPADRYRHAGALLDALRQRVPTVRPQAYLGQVERRGGGPLDLGVPVVRQAIVGSAGRLLDLGFKGVHYDIEPIYPGNQGFLDLLEQTHQLTRARGAVLSVAVEELAVAGRPQRAVMGAVPGVRAVAWQSPAYLEQVAARVDQVAVMTYGTGLPTDWLFGRYVARQTEQVVRLIGGQVTVFMGIPTENHPWRWAETVRSGVRGVRKGLAALDRAGVPTGNVGVALFAEWTTTPSEWATLERDWTSRP